MIGRVQRDELNRDHLKVNVAFTLSPGAYATLVIRRLFHFCYREDSAREIIAARVRPQEPDRPSSRSVRRRPKAGPHEPGRRIKFS